MIRAQIISQLSETAATDLPDRLVGPPSWMGHIPFAFWVMQSLRPSSFVELGTHTGVSYSAFCQTVQRYGLPTACFAVDNWEGDPQAGFYGDDIYQELDTYHSSRYATFSRLVRANFDDALQYFGDGSIDLLHIDGYHTYDAVKHDFEVWLPKMSERGVVLFHDINVRQPTFGAWQVWDELTQRYPGFGFLHSNGLGVLAVGTQVPAPIQWLIDTTRESEENTVTIRGFFAQLGEALTSRYERERLNSELKTAHAEEDRLRHEVVARDAEIVRINGEFAIRDNEILRLNTEVTTRDAEILRLNEEVTTRDTEILRLNTEVTTRDAEILRLNEEVTTRDTEILRLNTEVVARDAEILRLGEEAVERDRKIRLANNAVLIHEADISRLGNEIRNRDAEIGRISAELNRTVKEFAACGRELDQYVKEVDRLNQQISSLYRSTSWRVSRPLRWIKQAVAGKPVQASLPLMPMPAPVAASMPTHSSSPAAETLPPEIIMNDRPLLILVTHDCSLTGAPMVALNLARYFARQETLDLCVIAKGGGVLESEFASCGLYWNLDARPDRSQSAADCFASLMASFANRPIRGAICNTVVVSDIVAVLHAHKVPVISLVHELPSSIINFFGEEVFQTIDRQADAIVFGSEFVRGQIQDAFQPTNSRLCIVPTGYPAPKAIARNVARAEVMAELGLPQDAFLVMGCGTVDHRKGVDLFIQVAARVKAASTASRPCHFVWIGGGPTAYTTWCRHDLEAAKLHETVHLIGSRESIDGYLAAADAFLMCSREDPFPLVTLAAIAAGVPVVTFEGAGGTSEIIDNEAGVTVPYLDVDSMAKAVLRLHQEPEWSQALGDAGRARFHTYYTFDVFAQRLVDILQRDLKVTLYPATSSMTAPNLESIG